MYNVNSSTGVRSAVTVSSRAPRYARLFGALSRDFAAAARLAVPISVEGMLESLETRCYAIAGAAEEWPAFTMALARDRKRTGATWRLVYAAGGREQDGFLGGALVGVRNELAVIMGYLRGRSSGRGTSRMDRLFAANDAKLLAQLERIDLRCALSAGGSTRVRRAA